MKLFIINKDEFENQFDNQERFKDSDRGSLNSNQIHRKAYNILSLSIDIHNSIPLMLTPPYEDGDGIVIFDFITKKEDIYYYTFSTTAK